MSVAVPSSDVSLAVDPIALRRKLAWRIVPLIFLLYIVAFLDRTNISVAMLGMRDMPDSGRTHLIAQGVAAQGLAIPSVGTPIFPQVVVASRVASLDAPALMPDFTDDVIGLGSGLFFVGYLLLEIPGALLVERWSARKWFARILVTWGIISMGMALVRTPGQFYVVRILLGLAEAGFFPGVIVYFSHWFPRAQRGRAMAGMIVAVPVSQALGAFVSGRLLHAQWFDLHGWQWIFIVEGLPAVLLGVAVPFLLTDRPRHARWLTAAERSWLEETLEGERREAVAAGGATFREALRQPTVWLLALGIFSANLGGYALAFWLPTAIKNLLIATQGSAADDDVTRWACLIYLCGVVGVWVSGQLSDRTGKRKWLCVIGQMCAGVFLAISVIPDQSWGMVFAWLCLTGFFTVFWCSPFWVLPSQTLAASVAAVAVAFINMAANVAGFIGPSVIGRMKYAGYSEATCLTLLAACYLVGGMTIALLPRMRNVSR
jgi:ACS family tartrate transporter-like MFS transporter